MRTEGLNPGHRDHAGLPTTKRPPLPPSTMLRFSTLLLLTILLAACTQAEPTLDASSEQSLKQSIAVLTEGMSDADKEKLGKAILAQMFKDGFKDFDADSARKKLHGLTAAELLQRQEKLRVEQEAEASKLSDRLRSRLQEEITALEGREAVAAAAKTALEQFRVLKSSFHYSETRFSHNATIELQVKNDTKFAVSRVYFDAKLQSPGRSVPWVDSEFNYSIAGGLEPGEETTWKLSPNMFGEWSRAPRDRTDMVLTVTTTRIDGADGEPIFDADKFTDQDAKRLAELRTQLAGTPAAPR